MKRYIYLIGLAVLIHTVPSWGQPTIVDEKAWLQPSHFTNLSWVEIDAACPAGICNDGATLNGVDVSGYFWATRSDLDKLFQSYGAPPVSPLMPEENSTWAPAILADFAPTSVDPSGTSRLWCFTSDSSGTDIVLYDSVAGNDIILLGGGSVDAESYKGAAFYRPVGLPEAIPSLSIWGLGILAGLLGIIGVRRKKHRSEHRSGQPSL